MAVAANICVAWPSTIATIPSGWSRETALDARYILGAAVAADTDLITDRGNTTHIHTSAAHTPIQNSHTHDVETLGNDATTTIVCGTVTGTAAAGNHGHPVVTSSSTTATNNSVAITIDTTVNDLAYIEVIWIKSDGTPTVLPIGCYAFFASDTLPTSWSRVAGNQYLKGAAAGLSPAASGGANTHTHTSPAHTHTQNSHTHTATSSGPDNTLLGKGTGPNILSTLSHTHAITLAGKTAVNQSVTTTLTATNHEPSFTKLNTILSAAATLPSNIICLWLGSAGTIPTNWTRYATMNSRWNKGANADGESTVTTGGSTQHTHTATNCQPTQNSHTHTITDAASASTTTSANGTNGSYATSIHRHTSWTCTTDTATNNAISVIIDLCTADAALPKHRTVIYIQLTTSTPVVTRSGYTSYELNLFDIGEPDAQVLPEIGKRIAQGDLRYVPR